MIESEWKEESGAYKEFGEDDEVNLILQKSHAVKIVVDILVNGVKKNCMWHLHIWWYWRRPPAPSPRPPLQSQFILYFVAHSFWYVNRMARDASNEKIHNVFGLCTDCLWLEEEKKRVRFQRQILSTSWGRVEKKSSNRFQAFFHMLSETRESSWLGFNSNLIDWLPRNASHSELEWGEKS